MCRETLPIGYFPTGVLQVRIGLNKVSKRANLFPCIKCEKKDEPIEHLVLVSDFQKRSSGLKTLLVESELPGRLNKLELRLDPVLWKKVQKV
ncbi:hypothetical protein V6N11_002995 [Hibiscus sabdariffa]|uniref:Uncharacterized protein n=1 Tax=Hibiscus sabdariffa TaxID=183260 RepID=A0ABR2SC18_9ROSI